MAYDSDDQHLALGQPQAEHLAARMGGIVWPSCADLTAHDLLSLFASGRGGHLLMHGHYDARDPYGSGLWPAQDQFLPLWAACARPIPGGVFNLAACRAALAGPTTAELLGPVGIGPALVAAGATRVTGPLWSVHTLAAWAFFEADLDCAQAHPQRTAAERLPLTQEAMRTLSAERLRALVSNTLGQARMKCIVPNHPPLRDRNPFPFASPIHWAAFVPLGEG